MHSRRRFILQGAGLVAFGGAGVTHLLRLPTGHAENIREPIRPPTANPDDFNFQQACIRCGLCGTVCENGCIRFFGLEETEHGPLTPFIDPRRRSCTLCMRCTRICPTEALSPVEEDRDEIIGHIKMGVAVVDPERCLSYLGRVCGYCHDACPFPGEAISLRPPAKPVILADGCVGCGRCVETCPQNPTAIDVWRMQT